MSVMTSSQANISFTCFEVAFSKRQQPNKGEMDTSTYWERAGQTNIGISISRLLHEALDPVLAGRQSNKCKCQDKNTTFLNIQCCVLDHRYSRHGIQHTTYGRPPTRPSAALAKGRPIPRPVWSIAIQEDLHGGLAFSSQY
jgi:hypothetical protein